MWPILIFRIENPGIVNEHGEITVEADSAIKVALRVHFAAKKKLLPHELCLAGKLLFVAFLHQKDSKAKVKTLELSIVPHARKVLVAHVPRNLDKDDVRP